METEKRKENNRRYELCSAHLICFAWYSADVAHACTYCLSVALLQLFCQCMARIPLLCEWSNLMNIVIIVLCHVCAYKVVFVSLVYGSKEEDTG